MYGGLARTHEDRARARLNVAGAALCTKAPRGGRNMRMTSVPKREGTGAALGTSTRGSARAWMHAFVHGPRVPSIPEAWGEVKGRVPMLAHANGIGEHLH